MAPALETAVLTVAAVRRPKGARPTEYLFAERQQIFTLPSTAKSAASARRLSQAVGSPGKVKVVLDPRRGVIRKIEPTPPEEARAARQLTPRLEQPAKPVPIDVGAIDPTIFNVVDHHLKFPAFLLCTRIVPGYMKAKEIFDYCAAQSCHLPGPHPVSPCIPFQYVRDGCYARAHKMRWIIETKYGYCCEKVFSFANQNADRLAVKADKWGGCCVTWWYHVAPLIRVRVKLGRLSIVLALVVDPGMFDKPVLLSSWLSAQKNTGCDANANVSMYSIQPGSAYSPGNYAGTAFTTDPSYTATDATLTSYSSLTTCP